ncbi:organic cation/carnitine transporter 2-like [Dermacentor andersoni]|uniref:organic cation/carnitine transporter 2-like n=1 Tax=Dermacentor andersoni TaxID=34620 RepID=UPI003B3AA33E
MSSLIGNGPFQLLILLFAQVASALLTIHHLSMRLFLAPVDHWCRPPLEYSLSPEIWKNTSIPLMPDGSYSKCNMYHRTAHTANGSKVEVPCNEWEYALSAGKKSVVSEWNLVCDREWYICIAFLYNRLGAILVVPFSGQISDRIGRQPVICTCIIIAVASAGASVASKSFLAFVVSCMLLAASVSIVKLLIIIVLFENSGEGYRDVYVCLAKFGSIYGTVIVAVTDYYATQRIVFNLTVFLITLLLTSAYCFVDESVTWLLAYRDYDRAEHVIHQASARNRQPYVGHYIFGSNSTGYRPTSQLDINFATFVATHELRYRTAILSWILLCLFLVQYGMLATSEKVDTLRGKAALVLVRCCSFPLAWKLLRDFPRKTALTMALPMTCCLLCLLSVIKGTGADSVTLILEEVVMASIVGEAIVVSVSTLELFPTVIRGMGSSIVYFFGQVAVMLAPYIVLLSSRIHPNVVSVIFNALLLSAMGILRFLPETKERKLPRTMDDLMP